MQRFKFFCSNCVISYSENYSCSVAYSNYKNGCTVTYSYTNYANASHENSGAAYSFTWSEPALTTTGAVKNISDPKTYAAVLNELKTKINTLCSSKGRNSVTANSQTFTGGATSASGSSYNSLRTTLNNLYQDLLRSSTSVTPAVNYQRIAGTKISELKNQIDNLAGTSIVYANYVNTTAQTFQASCSTYIDATSYINTTTYTDTSSSRSSTATRSGAGYSHYLDYDTSTPSIRYS